jgi:cytoskeleton-associated protein 5
MRKEGLDQVVAILEAANKRIKPQLGDLISALKGRLNDSNKNLVMQTLDIIGTIAVAMGPPFERVSKILLSPILANLADNKAQLRSSVLSCLDSMCEVVSLNTPIPAISTAMSGSDNPNLRRELFTWLTSRIENLDGSVVVDATPLIPNTLAALQDRSQDVRKAAQSFLTPLVKLSGYDAVRSKCSDFKGSAGQAIIQMVDTYRSSEMVSSQERSMPFSTVGTTSPKPLKKSTSGTGLHAKESSTSTTSLARSGSKLVLGSRAKLSSAKLGSSTLSSRDSMEAQEPFFAFLPIDARSKEKRADQDRGMHKWTFESPRKDLIEFLREQAEAAIAPVLVSLMFSEDHHKEKHFVTALSILDDLAAQPEKAQQQFGIATEDVQQHFIANTDIIFKYLTIRFFDTNTSILLKLIDFMEHFTTLLEQAGYQMNEHEASAFLPFFITKVPPILHAGWKSFMLRSVTTRRRFVLVFVV